MTNKEIFNQFTKLFPQVEIKDYRPLEPIYYEDLKNKEGIIIYLKNDDRSVYFPIIGDKQIAKKPIKYNSVPHYRCPMCKNAVSVFCDSPK